MVGTGGHGRGRWARLWRSTMRPCPAGPSGERGVHYHGERERTFRISIERQRHLVPGKR